MRTDIAPGGIFPDHELTDHTKTRRKLSKLQGIDPMILVLSRGHFCPEDDQQHLELAAFYPKLAVAYTELVTISTDNILETNEFRSSVGAQRPSRPRPKGAEGSRDPGYTDPQPCRSTTRSTLVLKPGLVIHSVYNGYWYWGRPSIDDLRRDLREATREIRPDWDLTAPGLRAAWEAGRDRSRHYPYPEADTGRRAA